MYDFLLILQSAVCSPLSARYSALEMIGMLGFVVVLFIVPFRLDQLHD